MDPPDAVGVADYAQQAAFDVFLNAQKRRLLDNSEDWLRCNKLTCVVISTAILRDLRVAGWPQPDPATHSMEWLTYDWAARVFRLPMPPTPDHLLDTSNRTKVSVNYRAGAVNVIYVMTQAWADMTCTAPANYTFRGTKLVPSEAQQGTMGHPHNAGLFMKTTQTSGCWLGFGIDTGGDGATWAIHIQKCACKGAPTIDMYRDSDRIRIDMGNGRFLSRLTWLTPYMYYFDLFRDQNWGDSSPDDRKQYASRSYNSQIMGVPVGATGNTAVPSWRFCIQLRQDATPYTVLEFDMAQVGVDGAALINRPTEDEPPYYGQAPPDPPAGVEPDSPPDNPYDQLPQVRNCIVS